MGKQLRRPAQGVSRPKKVPAKPALTNYGHHTTVHARPARQGTISNGNSAAPRVARGGSPGGPRPPRDGVRVVPLS